MSAILFCPKSLFPFLVNLLLVQFFLALRAQPLDALSDARVHFLLVFIVRFADLQLSMPGINSVLPRAGFRLGTGVVATDALRLCLDISA